MITLAIIGSYGIMILAVLYLILTLPVVYIAAKNEQSPFLLWWMFLIVLLPFIGAALYTVMYIARKKRKNRFEIMPDGEAEEKSTQHQDQKTPVGIPEDTAAHILSCLDSFETKRAYLKANSTLASLAKEFNVSAKYLSSAITFYKKKKCSSYINTLRIDYLVEELRSGSDLRKYRMKPLARTIGFSTKAAFTMAFLRRTGMYPTVFIAELGYGQEEQWMFDEITSDK